MFGKFCLRVAAGIGVFLIFGGNDAMTVLVMSVICTMGLGLIVVLPAAYLVGLICTIWFIPFGRRTEKAVDDTTAERASAQPSETGKSYSLAELESLLSFVEAAEAKGRDWISIRNELLESGWDANSVERMMRRAGIVNPQDR